MFPLISMNPYLSPILTRANPSECLSPEHETKRVEYIGIYKIECMVIPLLRLGIRVLRMATSWHVIYRSAASRGICAGSSPTRSPIQHFDSMHHWHLGAGGDLSHAPILSAATICGSALAMCSACHAEGVLKRRDQAAFLRCLSDEGYRKGTVGYFHFVCTCG